MKSESTHMWYRQGGSMGCKHQQVALVVRKAGSVAMVLAQCPDKFVWPMSRQARSRFAVWACDPCGNVAVYSSIELSQPTSHTK
eukprot:3901793-Amphidinium_carterae.1